MDVLELLRAEQQAKRMGEPLKEQYGRLVIDLGTARTDEELHVSGDSIIVATFDGGATTTHFKLNHKHSRELYPGEVEKIYANFGGIYMTNAAEPGKSLVLYIGRALFIFPSSAKKVKILDPDGTNITVAHDERFKSHTGKHIKKTLAVADTAEFVTATETKVRWAIIGVEQYDLRWGFTDVSRSPGVGQIVSAGGYITVEFCDLSKLKFVNTNVGQTPTLQIEYVEEI